LYYVPLVGGVKNTIEACVGYSMLVASLSVMEYSKYKTNKVNIGANDKKAAEIITDIDVETKFGTFADMMEPAEATRYKEYWGWKYAETAPIEIPKNATMKIQFKTGYDQIQYKWSDGTYKYDARWHTRTPGAPDNQGNTWVVPGNANGQRSVSNILTNTNE